MRSKTCRLDLHTTPELRAKMEAEAERRGQSLTVFVTRALEAALSTEAGEGEVARVSPPRLAASPRAPHIAASEAAPVRKARDAAPNTGSGEGTTRATAPASPRRQNARPPHSPRCGCKVCKPEKAAKKVKT